MAAINSLFSMHSGDDKDLIYTIRDTAGATIDITGAAFTFSLSGLNTVDPAVPAPKGSPLIVIINGVQLVLNDPTNGVVTVCLLPLDTADLPAKTYYYELQMVLTSKTSTVTIGTLQLLKDLVA